MPSYWYAIYTMLRIQYNNMKLYATIQSERASKSQGGNRYLDIDIFTTSREKPTHHVHVIYDESGAIGVNFSALHFGVVKILAEDTVYTNVENGKQEKGEVCKFCKKSTVYIVDNYGDEYCEHCEMYK